MPGEVFTSAALLIGLGAAQIAMLAVLLVMWRRQRHQLERLGAELRGTVAAQTAGLRAEVLNARESQEALTRETGREIAGKIPKDTGAPKIMQKVQRATMLLGQQMEMRAHLCHMLDLPFGALPATRHWAASPDLLLHLAETILERKPRAVVECGAGLSTLVAARALQISSGGTVYSLESQPDFADKTRDRLRRLELQGHAKICVAPIEALPAPDGRGWYRLEALKKLPKQIDLLFVDGPQAVGTASREPALDHLLPRLVPGGALMMDDAGRKDVEAMRKAALQRVKGMTSRRLPAEKGAVMLERPAPAEPQALAG